MHGRLSFVSSCGTVVYTLNCENVHSSASDSDKHWFYWEMSHLKNTFTCVGISKEVRLNQVQIYNEKGHSKFDLANFHSTNWDLHNPNISLYLIGV